MRLTGSKCRHLHNIAYIGFVLISTSVLAQPGELTQQNLQNEQKIDAPSDLQNLMLEELIVTAQKRDQNLQDVPVAVTVLSGDKISETGLSNLHEFSAYIPNTILTTTPLGSGLFIRGIGSGANFSFEQSVAMFNDGVYRGRNIQMQAPLFDLNRIEVLKGPQGVLFGKNTIAGAVNLTSIRPSDAFEIQIGLGAGSNDLKKIEMAVGGSITHWLQGRLAIYSNQDQGWSHNLFTGKDGPDAERNGVRLSFATDNENDWQAYIKLERSEGSTTGQAYEVISMTSFALNISPLLNTRLPPHVGSIDSAYDDRSNFGSTDILGKNAFEADLEFTDYLVEIKRDLANHVFTSLTAYSSYTEYGEQDNDHTTTDVIGAAITEDFSQRSQEFRITSSPDKPFEYIAGIYLQQSKLNFDLPTDYKLTSLFGPLLSALPNQLSAMQQAEGTELTTYKLDTISAAGFFQGSLRLGDAFRITLGARYSYESKKVDKTKAIRTFSGINIDHTTVATLKDVDPNIDSEQAQIKQMLDTFWIPILDVYPYAIKDKRTEKHLTPQLIIEWTLNDNSMIYASATRGFKSGGFDSGHTNGLKLDSLEYDEEIANALEIGTKLTLFNNRATLNAAIYHTVYDDLQVSIYDGTSNFIVGNAAQMTSQGIELEGRFKLSDNLQLDAALARNNSEFNDFDKGACTTHQQAEHLTAQQAARESSNQADDVILSSSCFQNLEGKEGAFAPDWTASLRLTHHHPLSDRLLLTSAIDVNYSDDYFLAEDLDPGTLQEAYIKVNFRLALLAEQTWQLAFMVKNLTDKRTLATIADLPFGNGNFYASAACSQIPLLCRQTLDQVYDTTGSFFGLTEAPRTYTLDAIYRY